MTVRLGAVSLPQGNNQHVVPAHGKSKKNGCKKASIIAGNVLMAVGSGVMIFGALTVSLELI